MTITYGASKNHNSCLGTLLDDDLMTITLSQKHAVSIHGMHHQRSIFFSLIEYYIYRYIPTLLLEQIEIIVKIEAGKIFDMFL